MHFKSCFLLIMYSLKAAILHINGACHVMHPKKTTTNDTIPVELVQADDSSADESHALSA